MPNNDCVTYRASVVRSRDLITPSVSSTTTRQPVARFAQNVPVMPASQHRSLPKSVAFPTRETQHFRELSVHGKMRMVAETFCGGIARHSKATWQWCFADKVGEKNRDKQSLLSAPGAARTASEILALNGSKKSPSEKKCIATKKGTKAFSPVSAPHPNTAIKHRMISIIREPDIWNHDAMDIAVYGVADLLNVILEIEDVELKAHFKAGCSQNPEKIIRLRRSRPHGSEHYELIERSGEIRNIIADGNCLFRAVAAGYHQHQNDQHHAWEKLRQQTADYINDNWNHYAKFVEVQNEDSATSLNKINRPEKDSSEYVLPGTDYPAITETILGYIAITMHQELETFFNPMLTLEQKNTRENRERILNIFQHFFCRESSRKANAIIERIESWDISDNDKRASLIRLGELWYGLEDWSDDYFNLHVFRSCEKDFDGWDILFRSANKEFSYILWKKGSTREQFSYYLALSEAANLVEASQLLAVRLRDLLLGGRENISNDITKKIQNKWVVKMINSMRPVFLDIGRKIWHRLYQYDGIFSHLYDCDIHGVMRPSYYHDEIDVVAIRNRETRPEVIKARVNRSMAERFYQRFSLLKLYQSTINNSPLILHRAEINADTWGLIKLDDGNISDEAIKSALRINRGRRLNILLDNMFIAPLVVGDEFPLTSVNLKDLPFGNRGLSLKKIDRQFIDNIKISDDQLKAIAIYSNRLLREITNTGELYPSIEWMLTFEGDVLLALVTPWKNQPDDQNPSWFLIDKLQVIAQKLYGHKSFAEDVMILLENSLRFCHGEDLTIDELTYILTLPFDGMLRIVHIADQITAMAGGEENFYDPLTEWRRFVMHATGVEDLRWRLGERQRQQEASLQHLSSIPEPANL